MPTPAKLLLLFDRREVDSAAARQFVEDLKWYGLLDEALHPEGGPLDPAALFEQDDTWRLPIPGRLERLVSAPWQLAAEVKAGAGPMRLFDARAASSDVVLALGRLMSGAPAATIQPLAVLLDLRATGWLELLAALREGAPWATASDVGALGFGGAADLARAAFAVEGLAAPGPGISATGCLLANEHWALAGDQAGVGLALYELGALSGSAPVPASTGFFGVAPMFSHWLGLEHRPGFLEPQPATAFSHRIAEDGSATILLPGQPGTYKLSIEVGGEEWALYRLLDDEGALLGQIAAGPALGGATYPLILAQRERRPGPLRLVRDRASRALREGRAPSPVRRLWLSREGDEFGDLRPGGSGGAEGASPAELHESLHRRIGGVVLDEQRVYRLAPGSAWLDFSITRHRSAPGPLPLAAFDASWELSPSEVSSIGEIPGFEPVAAIAVSSPPGRALPRLIWVSDRPEGIVTRGPNGMIQFDPPDGATRCAIRADRSQA